MTDEIRRALQAWFDSPEGSEARQERIRAKIAELEMKEEPVRKRSWPRVLALALVCMLLVGTGLAAGITLNVFNIIFDHGKDIGYYDWQLQKLDSLRDKNTLVSTSASDVPQGFDMDDVIQIHDAYYDGEVLFVGCIESRWRMPTVEWTPTEEELAQFALPSAIRTENYKPVNKVAETLIEQVLDAGQPYGFKQYIYWDDFSDRLQTTDGNRLRYTSGSSFGFSVDDKREYHMTQFMAPLPEEIRRKDRIEVLLPVRFMTTYYWFDGEELYIWKGEDERAMLTAVIDRDQNARRGRYESAKMMLEGTEVTVEADANPYLLHVKLSADEPIFALLPNVLPWQWSVYDDAGHELEKSFMRNTLSQPLRLDIHEYSTDGLYTETWMWLYGEIPETLTLEIGRDYRKDEATVTLRLAE